MTKVAGRSGYFHGDLRRALIAAGLELARAGGASRVTIREATREAGVSPSAAYRHFDDRDSLVTAVGRRALASAADAMSDRTRAMLAALPADAGEADRAVARIRAIGWAYVDFAWREPGLFDVAYLAHRDLDSAGADEARGAEGLSPYEHLSSSLDALVDAGVLRPEQREGAEVLAWSSVHGYARLTLEGPLRAFDGAARAANLERVLDFVIDGIVRADPCDRPDPA